MGSYTENKKRGRERERVGGGFLGLASPEGMASLWAAFIMGDPIPSDECLYCLFA